MIAFILIHKLKKTSGISLANDFVGSGSTSWVSEQEMPVKETLADFFLIYFMPCEVAPVES